MQENTKPALLTLGLGLDLTTPKPAVESGSLYDCLNYEISSAQGLTRIDGYEPYDGQTTPDVTSFKLVSVSFDHDLSVGDEVATQEALLGKLTLIEELLAHDATGLIGTELISSVVSGFIRVTTPTFGVVPGSSATRLVHLGTVVEVVSPTSVIIACVNEELLRNAATLVRVVLGTPGVLCGLITAYADMNAYITNPATNFSFRKTYADLLRSRIGELVDVAALHWHRDTLYAVAPTLTITDASVGTLWRCRSIQQLLDDTSGNPLVVGWEEIDIGTAVKDIDGVVGLAKNQLPVGSALDNEASKYEFITANFYGSEGTTSIYGVSGAGKAFVYDGVEFRDINTGLSNELDKPRHIAKFNDRLVLGYSNGSILLSGVGEPENFDGLVAAEIAFGDGVTGLQVMAGSALGVFLENGIYYLNSDLLPKAIAPNLGCIEYTLTAPGAPLFCSPSGIMTVQQSEKYGEFMGSPLSDKVNPWLRPRLRRTSGKYASVSSVVGCTMVRSKNQYRLYFRDGYVLTMTITENGPAFTKQKLTYVTENDTPVEDTIVMYSTTSRMSTDGTEKLFGIHRNEANGLKYNRVLELDAGWGFAGNPIEHFFECNPIAGPDPFDYVKIAKARLHGLAKGKASLKIQTSGTNDGYIDDYNVTQEQFIDLPASVKLFTDDYMSTTNIRDLADRGLTLKLKISGRDATEAQPPHVCQLITVLFKSGGKSDI